LLPGWDDFGHTGARKKGNLKKNLGKGQKGKKEIWKKATAKKPRQRESGNGGRVLVEVLAVQDAGPEETVQL